MKQGISGGQLLSLIVMLRVSPLIRFVHVLSTGRALSSAWLASLLALVAGIGISLLAARLVDRYPRDTFGTLAPRILGVRAGGAVAAVVAGFFLVLALAIGRLQSLFIVTTAMERTPVWVIGLVVFGVGLYGAYLGSDTLARIAPIFLGLQVSYFVLGWLMLGFSETWDYSYVLPLLPVGILPTTEAAVVSTFWFASSALVVLALGADCNEEVSITGVVVRAHLISGLIALIWLVVILSMMGPIQAEFEGSPLYALSRVVFIRGILERADLLLYSSWIMGVSLEVGTYLLVSILILSDVLGVKPRSVWVFCAVLSLGAAIPTVPGLFRLAAAFTPQPIGGVLVVLHVGLVGGTLLVSRIRSTGGLTDEAPISRD